MGIVPNAAFLASFPADPEFEHPPGCYLARTLREGLLSLADRVEDFENWRDCGWSIECELEGCRFEIYFAAGDAPPTSDPWMIGIAPLGQPGPVRRLFGARTAPYTSQSRELARAVHDILSGDRNVSDVRWAMSSDPRDSEIREPRLLKWDDAPAG